MPDLKKERKISWYRSPVPREVLAELNQRSDTLGLLQTLGHLGLLALSGWAAWAAAANGRWWLFALLLFIHGTFFAFLLNGFHELCHKTVFRSKSLNVFFLYLISFFSWNHPVVFWASHQEHHKYTLHPPDDLEVVLPVRLTLKHFLKNAIFDPWDLAGRVRSYIRWSRGKVEGRWESALLPADAHALRSALVRWARIHLAGHALIIVVGILTGAWQLPLLVTFAPFYGGWLWFLCNNTQHIGLQDQVPDYRLCCRTIILNPFVRFLYWHMNFHTEHHMYAAVPCYHLGKLHKQIRHDLPPCPVGLVATWKDIIAILRRQATDPEYQYIAPLPGARP